MLGSEVVERAVSEWLHVAGISRPNFDKLSGSLNTTDLTFTVAGRLDDIPEGALIEIDQEVMAVDEVVDQTVTVLGRGYLNTDAAAHSNEAPVYVNPKFFQSTLLNHLQTCIGKLYGWGFYKRVVTTALEFPIAFAPLEMPAGAKRVRSVRPLSPAGMYGHPMRRGKSWFELTEFDPPQIQFVEFGGVSALAIVYAADWERPTWATDLDDLDLPASLQDGLPMAVAGYALQGMEGSRLNVDDIKKLIAAQGSNVPIGSHLNVGRSLIQSFIELHVTPEKQRLEELDGHTVEYVA